MKKLVILFLMLGIFIFPVFNQVNSTKIENFSGVGIIRQIISENSEFSHEETSYIFENQDGSIQNLNNVSVKFAKYINFKVALLGSRSESKESIDITSVNLLEKMPKKRELDVSKIPPGITEYDLDTKEGQREFNRISLGGGIVQPNQTAGTREVNVVLVNFANNNNPLFSNEEYESRIFTGHDSVKNFFAGASFGDFKISGNIIGPITLPSDANCEEKMFSEWIPAIKSQLPPNNIYNWQFISQQIPDCSYQAVSTVGTKGVSNSVQTSWIQQSPILNSRKNFVTTSTHEFGHQFGFLHPDGIDPFTLAIYGSIDQVDFVTGELHYPNAYNRLAAGWLGKGKITIINGVGNFNIRLKSPAIVGDKQASRIVIVVNYNSDGSPAGTIDIGEIRANAGPNQYYENFNSRMSAYLQGVSWRYGSIDLTASTSKSYLYKLNQRFDPYDFDKAPLAVGQTFNFASTGTTLTGVSYTQQRGFTLNVITTRGPSVQFEDIHKISKFESKTIYKKL